MKIKTLLYARTGSARDFDPGAQPPPAQPGLALGEQDLNRALDGTSSSSRYHHLLNGLLKPQSRATQLEQRFVRCATTNVIEARDS